MPDGKLELRLILKHLPGRHDQQAHGRGWNGGRGHRRDERGRFSGGGGSPAAAPPGPKVGSRVEVEAFGSSISGELLSLDDNGDFVVRTEYGDLPLNRSTSQLRAADEPKPPPSLPREPERPTTRPEPRPTADSQPPLSGEEAFDLVPASKNEAGREALLNYQETLHGVMNDFLRHNRQHPDPDFAARGQAAIADLDRAFEELAPLERGIIVHRGVSNLDSFLGPYRQRIGQTFADKGYVSTSTESSVVDARFAKQGRLEIVVPAGAKALKSTWTVIEGLEEREVLLPRGSQFRVVDDDLDEDFDPLSGDYAEIRRVRLEVLVP